MTDTVTISREALEKAKAAKQKLLARHMKVLAELSKDPFFAYSIDHDLGRELLEAAVAIDRLTAALSSPPPPSGPQMVTVTRTMIDEFGNKTVEASVRPANSSDNVWLNPDRPSPPSGLREALDDALVAKASAAVCDEWQKMIAEIGVADAARSFVSPTNQRLVRACLRAARASPDDGWVPTHQHVKTGGLYHILARGKLEWDLTEAVVYQAKKDGSVWVRPASEFDDGRFIAHRPSAEQGE